MAKTPPPFPEKPVLPEFWFDARGKGYWMKMRDGEYVQMGAGDLKLHLRGAGLYDGKVDTGLNPCEKELTDAQQERRVAYAGPLAGYRIGFYTPSSTERILVTSEPHPAVFEKPIKKWKKPKFILTYLEELLGKAQTPVALWWMKCAVESLAKRDFCPGQFVALAGKGGCGKSFFHVLVTELLGGRSSKPFKYMMGRTEFNEQLSKAEHLFIEDETASTNTAARRDFGNQIKQMTVNEEFEIHGKGKEAKTLPTFRRLTCTFNDEPENLAILPPLDGSLLDKLIIFKCSHATLNKDRPTNKAMLKAEIPHLRAMLYELEIPKAYQDDRFGVISYHHPDIVAALSELAPETRLLNLIDEIIFASDKKEKDGGQMVLWRGTADGLERELRQSSFHHAVENLLRFSSACGVYLQRLSSKMPQRINFKKSEGKTEWEIRK